MGGESYVGYACCLELFAKVIKVEYKYIHKSIKINHMLNRHGFPSDRLQKLIEKNYSEHIVDRFYCSLFSGGR